MSHNKIFAQTSDFVIFDTTELFTFWHGHLFSIKIIIELSNTRSSVNRKCVSKKMENVSFSHLYIHKHLFHAMKTSTYLEHSSDRQKAILQLATIFMKEEHY